MLEFLMICFFLGLGIFVVFNFIIPAILAIVAAVVWGLSALFGRKE